MFINRFSVVARLGESSFCAKALVFGVVDCANERGAACLGPRNEMNRHDTLNPLTTREVQHVISSSVATSSSTNVLFGYHAFDKNERIRRRNNEDLVNEWFQIVYPSFEVFNGVFVLELEVAFIIVNTCHDEAAKLSKRDENILVASVEQVEAANGVHLPVFPAFGKLRLEGIDFNNKIIDSSLEHFKCLAFEIEVSPHDLLQTPFTNRGSSLLIVFLEYLVECSLVQFKEFKKEGQFTLESHQGFLGIYEVLEMPRFSHFAVFILEPFEFAFNSASLGQSFQGNPEISNAGRARAGQHGCRIIRAHA